MSATSASLTKKELSENRNFFSAKKRLWYSWGISLPFYLPHKQVSPVTLTVDLTLLLFQLTVTNIHNFDSETQLSFTYNDQIGTIYQL